MPRLTITLADRTHRALKKAAARQGRSMSSIIEESLEMRGIRTSTRLGRSSPRYGRDPALTRTPRWRWRSKRQHVIGRSGSAV